jgi:hypothetical protein
MLADVARLVLGLLVVLFHRPIADFILERERALDTLFRSRGLNLPSPPSQRAAHNIYFILGAFMALFALGHLWLSVF